MSDGITVTNRSGDDAPENVIESLRADKSFLQGRVSELKEKLQQRDDELERWPDQVSDAIGEKYVNRDGEDVLTQITRVITDLESEVEGALACANKAGQLHGEVLDKLRLAEDFGMKFGVLKSSDCKEGKMAFDVKKGSELWRLELEIAENIESKIAVDDILDLVRAVKETKVPISMSDSPWPGRDGDGFVIPSDVIKNLEPLFESLGDSTPRAMGRGLGAAMVAWFKNKAKEEGTTVQQEIEKVIGEKPEKASDGVTCPACRGKEPDTVKDMCDLCNGMGVVYRFVAEEYAVKTEKKPEAESPTDTVTCPMCKGKLTPAGTPLCILCNSKGVTFRETAERYKGGKDG